MEIELNLGLRMFSIQGRAKPKLSSIHLLDNLDHYRFFCKLSSIFFNTKPEIKWMMSIIEGISDEVLVFSSVTIVIFGLLSFFVIKW